MNAGGSRITLGIAGLSAASAALGGGGTASPFGTCAGASRVGRQRISIA